MKRKLHEEGPVVGWLLQEDNPCVRYLTMTKLLGMDSRNTSAIETRRAIPEWAPVKRMLSRQMKSGGWDEGDSWYIPKYKSTIWQLIILSQTGIDPAHPCIQRMCSYAKKFQTTTGGFGPDKGRLRTGGWAREAGCLTGNVIAALCRLGDARSRQVKEAMGHLISIQKPDGGWGCDSFGYHSRDKHSCFMGNICALDGLNEYVKTHTQPEVRGAIDRACEFLLMHRMFRADHHGWKIIRGAWTELQSPYFVGYDILRGLLALKAAGRSDDTRAKEAFEMIESKQLPNGRWARGARWPTNTYSTFGRVGEEDKWVTLNAMLALSGRHPRE